MNEIKRLWRAAGYSWQGLRAAVMHEPAFRTELVLLVFLLPAAFWVGRSPVQYALLAGTLLLVMITELVNSAIEAVVDRFGEERHELSGRAKDMASAAVLIAVINFFIIWGILLYHRITI